MRRKGLRAALAALLALGVVLAFAMSATAADPSTGAASVSAGDGSLTIGVVSQGNAADIHGNVNYWTSPIDPSGSFYWFNQPVSVTDFSFPDTGNGLPVFQSAMIARNIGMGYATPVAFAGPYTVSEEGVYSITAEGNDDVGSVSGTITPAFGLDMTDPVVTTDRTAFYAADPVVTVTATDTISGIENVLFTVDGLRSYSIEPDPLAPGEFSVPFNFLGEGAHFFKWVAFDNAGNAVSGAESFRVDKTAPTTSSNAVALYNGPASIQLTAADDALGSGVAHTYYRLDGSTTVEGAHLTVPAPVNGSAAHTLEFWSVDAVGNEETPHQSVSFTVNSRHTIRVLPVVNGTITPSGTATINLGASSAVYRIRPRIGYHITSLRVDGLFVSARPSYQFTNVVANHTLGATFAINRYTITPSRSNKHGRITPSTKQTVNYGSRKTFTMKAYARYKIKKVVVDGVSVGAKTSYTFSNIKRNHTIRVYFVRK